jgi:septum formation protein
MRIILASQSPRRKKLLSLLGFQFEIVPSSIDEISSEKDPVKLVEDLAFRKAEDISKKYSNSLIIGSDTIVVYNDSILGKPETTDEASKTLNMLSGKQHKVYTGVSLIRTDDTKEIEKKILFTEVTTVTFSKLDQEDIDFYISTGNPMDKAGSYGIQDDWGATFVSKIEGDFYNVVGLPINNLYHQLKLHFPETMKNKNISN